MVWQRVHRRDARCAQRPERRRSHWPRRTGWRRSGGATATEGAHSDVEVTIHDATVCNSVMHVTPLCTQQARVKSSRRDEHATTQDKQRKRSVDDTCQRAVGTMNVRATQAHYPRDRVSDAPAQRQSSAGDGTAAAHDAVNARTTMVALAADVDANHTVETARGRASRQELRSRNTSEH